MANDGTDLGGNKMFMVDGADTRGVKKKKRQKKGSRKVSQILGTVPKTYH